MWQADDGDVYGGGCNGCFKHRGRHQCTCRSTFGATEHGASGVGQSSRCYQGGTEASLPTMADGQANSGNYTCVRISIDVLLHFT